MIAHHSVNFIPIGYPSQFWLLIKDSVWKTSKPIASDVCLVGENKNCEDFSDIFELLRITAAQMIAHNFVNIWKPLKVPWWW